MGTVTRHLTIGELMNKVNPFLIELLTLQQDGEQAISAPTNWSWPPILEVETPLDKTIDKLVEECIGSTHSDTGRWHFLVGSPGNGKSAAVGRLVRQLVSTHHCRIIDEDTRTPLSELPATPIPYALEVYEPSKKYKFLQIVQDASVVRKPFSKNSDPSKDLLDTLKHAWSKGISLVVCTNRGVLEKAYRDTSRDPDYSKEVWHKEILKPLVEHSTSQNFERKPIQTSGEKKVVFQAIVVSADFLDTQSLLLKPSNVFEHLIEQATTDNRWEECSECSSRYLCPLKGNRDWLFDPTGKQAVVLSFRRAETLSSQVIVLREALAALSFLLAGCVRDYTNTNPCNWVHERVTSEDYFALASRRIYMSLYASNSPRGLDYNAEVQQRQKHSLENLRRSLSQQSMVYKALTATLEQPHPSTDVGIKRLLDNDGVFSKLNATRGPLPPDFFDRWDGNHAYNKLPHSPFVTELEIRCAKVWEVVEDACEGMPTHNAVEAYWCLRRWSSQFTLHFGALVETRHFDQNRIGDFEYNSLAHIDEFSQLIELLAKADSLEDNEARLLHNLRQITEKLLNQTDEMIATRAAINLTGNVSVNGQWFQDNLRPQIKASPASGSLTVAIYFDKTEYTTLAAPMYLWLKQRLLGTMVKECIPTTTLREAIDAKSRAAAKSSYAYAQNDVVMSIIGEQETFFLTRADGRVILDKKSREE